MITVFVAGCFHLVDGFSVEGGLDGLSKKDRAYAELFLEEYPNGFDVPEGCKDIVQVAQSQVGNVGGRKYWSWYGFNSRVEWCACFVSWCGNQCGYIADGKMPRFAGVGVGVDWFKSHKQWKGRNYVPKPGNIIFFDWIPYGNIDHVGIVIACDGKTVYTIEGNSHDTCRERSYREGERCIYGYGWIKS